jgi:hypothetical protein
MMDPPCPSGSRHPHLPPAGIRIVMITGDYGLTADHWPGAASFHPNPRIITGAELDEMVTLNCKSAGKVLLARMAPHKCAWWQPPIARRWVAVTGDESTMRPPCARRMWAWPWASSVRTWLGSRRHHPDQ